MINIIGTSCEPGQACHTCKETNKNAKVSLGIHKKLTGILLGREFGVLYTIIQLLYN